MAPIRGLIVGCGQRGSAYASYSLDRPDEVQIVAIAEPREFKRQLFTSLYKIADDRVFKDWREIAELKEKIADFVVVATQDQQHKEPAIAFAKLGYHVLLEKPMAVTEEDCRAIAAACEENNVMLVVCHVLRYTPANQRLRDMITSGVIGDVINIQHTEPVGFYHFAHSFVRGNWRREDTSTFSLLAKSCHDIDLIRYWMGRDCVRVSSFGSLNHFKQENKPEGAASRCMECPVEDKCVYSAKKIYLDLVKTGHTHWPVSVITEQVPDIESVTSALQTGPYGRCVYECDNDVVDSQVVIMEFEGGRTATFNMVAFTEKLCQRQTFIFGTKGQLSCTDGDTIEHFDFLTRKTTKITGERPPADSRLQGHGGADYFLMHSFVRAVTENKPELIQTSAGDALASHLLVFAAERARKQGKVLDL